MPKRLCPFVESNRPQLKSHIGIKEVNMGVMMKENMKRVYDKTMNMMYQAAKSVNKENEGPCSQQTTNRLAEILPGQRRLNFSGQLDGVYRDSQNGSRNPNMFLPIACSTCRNIPSVPKTCHYCERCLCEFCNQPCFICQNSYCSECVIIRYKQEGEECLCLSCI